MHKRRIFDRRFIIYQHLKFERTAELTAHKLTETLH